MSANRFKLNSEKTELVWVGSRYGHTPLGIGSDGPTLKKKLGTDTVAASDHVRFERVCEVFFLASPTETSPTFTRR